VAQKQKPRKRSLIRRELAPDWPTWEQVLRGIRIAILVIFAGLSVLLLLYVIGLLFGMDGRVRLDTASPLSPLWPVLKVLAVPITVGAAVPLLNWLQKKRELEIAEQRAQDEALQAYLNKMSELLIDEKLHDKANPYDDTRVTARARTLAVLSQLDGERKRTVLLFLRESRLINRDLHVRNGRTVYARIVGLRDADLRNANLQDAKLINTLRDEPVSLEGAILEGADLQGADLEGADLQGADLRAANLRSASLRNARLQSRPDLRLKAANLSNADLSEADLSGAILSGAILRGAILRKADLRRAYLDKADLRDAKKWTAKQLTKAESLKGATMPDGSKHP
jgi:uncharacterized protein YjbI with pentapeptide repeats